MILPTGPAHGQGRNGATAKVSQPPEFEGGLGTSMVTDMVQRRKLTRDFAANFPALDAEVGVAKKGDI